MADGITVHRGVIERGERVRGGEHLLGGGEPPERLE